MMRLTGCEAGRRRGEGRGFTLVELLVVIAIVVVLSGMLLPTVAKAKSEAHAAQCLSNQRQINLALQMFAEDHYGYLPGSGSTSGLGVGQMLSFPTNPARQPDSILVRQGYAANASVFACPQVFLSQKYQDQMRQFYNRTHAFHYKFNVDFVGTKQSEADSELPARLSLRQPNSDDPNWTARRLTDADLRPSLTILAGDYVGANDSATVVHPAADDPSVPATAFFGAMHNSQKRAVVNFADGHLERVRVENQAAEFFDVGMVPTF